MNIYTLISLFSSLLGFVVGTIVIMKNPRNDKNIAFFVLCIISSLVSFFEFEVRSAETFETALFWSKASGIWPLVFSFSYDFIARFYGFIKSKLAKIVNMVVHLSAILISLTDIFTNKLSTNPKRAYWGWKLQYLDNELTSIIFIWILIIFIVLLFLSLKVYLTSKDLTKKKQAKFIFAGFFITFFIGIVTDIYFTVMDFNFPELSNSSNILAFILVGFAMIRYNLFVLEPSVITKQIVETIPGSLILTDSNGNIIFFNHNTLDLFNIKKSELIYSPINKIFKSESLQQQANQIVNNIKFNEIYQNGDKHIHLLVNRMCIRDSHKQPQGYIYLVEDIGQLKELKNGILKAEQTDKLKTEFVKSVYEEVRNPLNIVLNSSEILINSDLPDFEKEEYIKSIDEKGKSLNSLINKILELIKIENNQVDLIISNNDLNQIINQIKIETIKDIDTNKIKFYTIKTFDEHQSMVNIDKEKVTKALKLICELLLYYSKRGTVKMGYFLSTDNKLQFYVSSSDFNTSDKSTIRAFKYLAIKDVMEIRVLGYAGMNLALAKSHVEKMQGSIWWENEDNNTLVYFTIPYYPVR